MINKMTATATGRAADRRRRQQALRRSAHRQQQLKHGAHAAGEANCKAHTHPLCARAGKPSSGKLLLPHALYRRNVLSRGRRGTRWSTPVAKRVQTAMSASWPGNGPTARAAIGCASTQKARSGGADEPKASCASSKLLPVCGLVGTRHIERGAPKQQGHAPHTKHTRKQQGGMYLVCTQGKHRSMAKPNLAVGHNPRSARPRGSTCTARRARYARRKGKPRWQHSSSSPFFPAHRRS